MNLKDARKDIFALYYTLGVAALIIVWEVCALYFDAALILPSPVGAAKKLVALVATKTFLKSLGMSFARVISALFLAVPLGILTGLLCAVYKKFDAFLRPFFMIVASTPVMAIILIIFLWFGAEVTPVWSAFLVIFPVITANTAEAVNDISRGFMELFDVFDIKKEERLKYLYMPEIMPYLRAGLRSSLSLCWKVVIAAEILVQPELALGTGMQSAKANLETEELFAWTAASVLAATLCEFVFKILEKKVIRY